MERGKPGREGIAEAVRWVSEAEVALTARILAAAIEVHRELGPGFLESIYQRALAIELDLRGIRFHRESEIDVLHRGLSVGRHRLDFVVERLVIVELKAVHRLEGAHFAQVKSYLKAAGIPIGLLLNFSSVALTIKRLVVRHPGSTTLPSAFPSLPRFPRPSDQHAKAERGRAAEG